jgi:hypothetical protein
MRSSNHFLPLSVYSSSCRSDNTEPCATCSYPICLSSYMSLSDITLHMDRVDLVDGWWADGLEILRSLLADRHGSSLIFRHVLGAETGELNRSELDSILETPCKIRHELNRAEAFILGRREINPLRFLQTRESSEPLTPSYDRTSGYTLRNLRIRW